MSKSDKFYSLHKNDTMVVLLKTMLVQVSFSQIVQIRVQNKSKSVRKSRYDGDVSPVGADPMSSWLCGKVKVIVSITPKGDLSNHPRWVPLDVTVKVNLGGIILDGSLLMGCTTESLSDSGEGGITLRRP